MPAPQDTAGPEPDAASHLVPEATAGRIFGLAVPALGVLAAEPLYLLFDIAVVGRLGALALAGLAIGGLVLAQVSTQLTFLSYGTTARAARFHGAGRRDAAVAEGVQATWLALAVGTAILIVGQLLAEPVAALIAGDEQIAEAAVSWLRVALFGAPLILVGLAGNGWMRGVQDTARPLRYVLAGLALSAVLCPLLVHGLAGAPRWELVGSALANVAGQSVSAALFVGALLRSGVPLRPQRTVIAAQVRLGRDLIARSLAFQACFLSAAAVAARFGAAAVAAHQVVLQLWNFVSLTLDSLAVAAQALVGAALGGGARSDAKRLAWRITAWSTVFATGLALVFLGGGDAIPALFTSDPGVLEQIDVAWWFFVALLPVAGVVFALDGVLLGAGDAAFLRTATLASALFGFLPLVWCSLVWDWGLAGIWTGLTVFIVFRMAAVVWRTRSGRWAVTGADRQARPPHETARDETKKESR
ncbi:multidrug transporter MatE [Rhodococcus ruber Chol-4]|uniref:MATE family efflux transporter n=1 Tax=Rhodococcus TaxID=1827 RepID=UPI00029A0A58|nr:MULTISPECIES: MATE family efflux transporter [Rhodococcus]MDO2377734.1 MATE family efflux transporter [Rhodococcus ruber]ATQ27516.1 MATE family efflux transporter [Rhodococcus ruber]KXF86368.1 multidrug transporter MatE [Rhodococcus ruber Chol-4]MCZ1073524.1 MATE family efflux transporter [Rhodococcus sp. A5(2022)]UIR38038.1 MATE family efflux transporter [Rhodococcus sp. DMF-1]